MKILITGGAGYLGTSLIPQLLSQKHKVTVLDNLTYGGDPLIPFFQNKNFSFIKGDIRNNEVIKEVVKNKDIIVHLAAVVGYPACRRDPTTATEINVNGTQNLIDTTSPSQLILFSSTGDGYSYTREVVTEETPLHPLSLYGQTKELGEKMLMERGNCVIFRFASAFGVSPRLRLDLMINDFTYKAVTEGYLIVYEKNYRRTFIHVSDMAKAIVFATKHSKKMINNIFNIGSTSLNITKAELCNLLEKKVKVYVHYAEFNKDQERRDQRVSFKKIEQLGYKTSVTIEQGIDELIRVIPATTRLSQYSYG